MERIIEIRLVVKPLDDMPDAKGTKEGHLYSIIEGIKKHLTSEIKNGELPASYTIHATCQSPNSSSGRVDS